MENIDTIDFLGYAFLFMAIWYLVSCIIKLTKNSFVKKRKVEVYKEHLKGTIYSGSGLQITLGRAESCRPNRTDEVKDF